jgi:7-cyano-7-deazaguanine reductase
VKRSSTKGLSLLGAKVELPSDPDIAVLERVPYEQTEPKPCVRLAVPEFTAMCPMTGQPDFAHLVIDYVPNKWIVESKSLKLYMGSFRNAGIFHEDCTVGIGLRLVKLLSPRWLRIGGYWYPRGRIPIDVFWQTGLPPKGVWIPEQGVSPYRGRG